MIFLLVTLALSIPVVVLSLTWSVASIAPAAAALITGKFTSFALFALLKWRYGNYAGDVLAQRLLKSKSARAVASLCLAVAALWLLRVIYDTLSFTFALSFWDGFIPAFVLMGILLLRGARKSDDEDEAKLVSSN